RIGAFHVETLGSLESIESIVVADADPARARDVAARHGAEHVASPADLFTADIDGLVIAAATDAHPALILSAVDNGIPVFCEKPVAPDAAGTRAVLDKVRAVDVPVQIGFQRRFDAG